MIYISLMIALRKDNAHLPTMDSSRFDGVSGTTRVEYFGYDGKQCVHLFCGLVD